MAPLSLNTTQPVHSSVVQKSNREYLTRCDTHTYAHTRLLTGKETAAAQSAEPFLMSLFPSPSIRMELGQHSATEGSEAGRMGACGRGKKSLH